MVRYIFKGALLGLLSLCELRSIQVGKTLVAEEKKEHQEEELGKPEENGPIRETEGSSPAEERTETTETEQVEGDEEEGKPVEEAEDEELIAEEPIPRRGCLTGCLTPIAVILVVLLVAFTIGYSKRDALRVGLLNRIIANTQNHVLDKLPADMDGKAVEATFEKVRNALEEGMMDEEALSEAIREYQDAMRKMPPLAEERLEIDKLMATLSAAILVIEE